MAGPLLFLPLLAGVNFGLYDFVRQHLTTLRPSLFSRRSGGGGYLAAVENTETLDLREHVSTLPCVFLAGVASGWIVCHVTCPMNNLKVQQQTAGSSLLH